MKNRKNRRRSLWSGLTLVTALAAGQLASAGPADAGGPPAHPAPQADRPDDPPPRRPAGPVTVQRAIEELRLSDEQKQKVAPLLEEYRQKERQAREELGRRLKDMLDERQAEQFQRAMQPEGRPPRPDGDRETAGRESRSVPASTPAAATAAAAPVSKSVPADGVTRLAVTFTGGHDTDPRDHGRPVALVAAALGVAPEVFQKAFSHVTPASGGREPEPEQVRKNKQALLSRLGPLGVTNERLDQVSNYYRYRADRGELWRTTPATAYATVRDGVVTGITITDAGSGYSSPPHVSIEGKPEVKAAATLAFGKDLTTNGSVKEITLQH